MNRMRLWLSLALAALALSLLLSRAHLFGYAGLRSTPENPQTLLDGAHVPGEARAVLITKCADCHSDQTRAPFYARFAPVSWLVERDIVEGRRHMNLSRWTALSDDERQTVQAKIVQQVRTGAMPPVQYRIIHWNARITGDDVKSLAAWARSTPSPELTALPSSGRAAVPGDADRGKVVFEKRCTGCHALNQDREGPRLAGVYGRVSGTVPGFAYSDGLKKAHLVWTEKTLDQWLIDPDTLVPDNNMDFRVPKADERRDLIAFLKKSSSQ